MSSDSLKSKLRERGMRGIVGAARSFRAMDDDGSKTLSLGEFKKGLKDIGLSMADQDIRIIFDQFDR
jgi:calcyphosin